MGMFTLPHQFGWLVGFYALNSAGFMAVWVYRYTLSLSDKAPQHAHLAESRPGQATSAAWVGGTGGSWGL